MKSIAQLITEGRDVANVAMIHPVATADWFWRNWVESIEAKLQAAGELLEAVDALEVDAEMVADYAVHGYGFEVYRPAREWQAMVAAAEKLRDMEKPRTL